MVFFIFYKGIKPIQAPRFWYHRESFIPYVLQPLALLYKAVTLCRACFSSPIKMPVPVVCIGNIVMGGAGKTPTTLMMAEHLQSKGLHPHILSRGYGGTFTASTKVDPAEHDATQVGDEPLLLAKTAPTWIGKNRQQSAVLAVKNGADILLMDDGLQNEHLKKDISLLVIDGNQGFGNQWVFPAGPLRETVQRGLKKADAVIFIGHDRHNILRNIDIPVIHATIRYKNANPKKVLAFCGLGYPQKFFLSLQELGYDVVDSKSFADHYPYTAQDMKSLIHKADELKATLITTEKDLLKIPQAYHHKIEVLEMRLHLENTEIFDNLLQKMNP
ncbi:MAG: tetraacyldisaccharide 4'-kinase [Alphaproteobacteria bacterium]|nr:tetraacyldisaccharide 4'-kinase [Alphaproteobacteria bacterium]